MKVLTMADITMFDLANGITGTYKGFAVEVVQVGRMSYCVTANNEITVVGGVKAVKRIY